MTIEPSLRQAAGNVLPVGRATRHRKDDIVRYTLANPAARAALALPSGRTYGQCARLCGSRTFYDSIKEGGRLTKVPLKCNTMPLFNATGSCPGGRGAGCGHKVAVFISRKAAGSFSGRQGPDTRRSGFGLRLSPLCHRWLCGACGSAPGPLPSIVPLFGQPQCR